MSPSKLICLKLFNQMTLSLVIPDVLCLPMWSPPHGLVGSTGERTWKRALNFYLYFISRTFEFISLELTHLLAK